MAEGETGQQQATPQGPEPRRRRTRRVVALPLPVSPMPPHYLCAVPGGLHHG